jgi:hypothetical protein
MNDPAGYVRTSAAVALLAGGLMPAPLAAMPPLFEACPVTGAGIAQRMSDGVPGDAAGADSFDNMVIIDVAGDGVATWMLGDAVGVERHVLQHCGSGRELTVTAAPAVAAAVAETFADMVFGDAPHSMAEIAQATGALGAEVAQTRNTQGDCACLVLFGTE